MPSVTTKQHNAMEAAARGHSTLGIPKSVGQEFVAADKQKRRGLSRKRVKPDAPAASFVQGA